MNESNSTTYGIVTRDWIHSLKLQSKTFENGVISNAKAIVSGKHIELSVYSRPQSSRFIHAKRPRRQVVAPAPDTTELRITNVPVEGYEGVTTTTSTSKKPRRKDNTTRARKNLVRIARANTTRYTRFGTLTYKDAEFSRKKVQQDLRECNQRLARALYRKSINCVYVLERQKKRGIEEGNEGSWHVHILYFNIPYFKNETFAFLFWQKGFVKLTTVNSSSHGAFYLAKYFTKDEIEGNYIRAYSPTLFLRKGLELHEQYTLDHLLEQACSRGYLYKQSKPFENPYTGAFTIYYEIFPPVESP